MIKVWESTTPESNDDEKQLYFRLNEDENGDIKLLLCNKDGSFVDSSTICFFDNDAKIFFMEDGINPNLGIKTENHNYAVTIKKHEQIHYELIMQNFFSRRAISDVVSGSLQAKAEKEAKH